MAYFDSMLERCVSECHLNYSGRTMEEIIDGLFNKEERKLNVEQCIKSKFPLNAGAMLYYAQCARLHCIEPDTGNVDIPRYGNLIQGMIIYLVGCRHFEILDLVYKQQIIDEFKDNYLELIEEQKTAQNER